MKSQKTILLLKKENTGKNVFLFVEMEVVPF